MSATPPSMDQLLDNLLQNAAAMIEGGMRFARDDDPEKFATITDFFQRGMRPQLILTLGGSDGKDVSIRGVLVNDELAPIVQIFEIRANAMTAQ